MSAFKARTVFALVAAGLAVLSTVLLPGSGRADNADHSLSITLRPEGSGEGAGFGEILSGSPSDLTVTLTATAGYTISGSTVSDSGDGFWSSNQTFPTLSVSYTTYCPRNSDHGVRFDGTLLPTGGSGSGKPPQVPFDAAVADLEFAGHRTDSSENEGILVPGGMVSSFPPQLGDLSVCGSTSFNIKTHWAGPRVNPPDPNFVGTVTFAISGSGAQGIALYTLTAETLPTVSGGTVAAPAGTQLASGVSVSGTQTTGGIRVPVGGFVGKPLGILTKQNAAGSATIKATFTWDPDIRASSYTAVDWRKVTPVVLQVVDFLAHSSTAGTDGTGAYQSVFAVSGGSLDVKTHIKRWYPARLRLQVLGTPSLNTPTFMLSGGTISFNSDSTNAMHQALYSSAGTVACALPFSGSVWYASEWDSLGDTGSKALILGGSLNSFYVNWNGRDTYENPLYDPTGQGWQLQNANRLLLAGNYTVSASVSISGSNPNPMTISTTGIFSQSSSAQQLAVALPHSGHYGDDWPRASVYQFIGSPGGGTISKSNMVPPGPAVPDDLPLPDPIIAPMLLNYFETNKYGASYLNIHFHCDTQGTPNAWFVYTDGFNPEWDKKKDRPNVRLPTMWIAAINGGAGALSRSPTGARAIAAVWNPSGGTGNGGWDMKWSDDPAFGKGSISSFTPYMSNTQTVSAPPTQTQWLSFDGTDPASHPDFRVQLPGTPNLSGSAGATPWQVLYVLPPVTIAPSGNCFNAAADPSVFVSVNLDGLTSDQTLKCFLGYPTGVRQFTQASFGTLGSCGVDRNSLTCGTLGYQSLMYSNSTPAQASAHWLKKLALVTDDGHAGPGRIGFYWTTHPDNCPTASGAADSYGELFDPAHDSRIMSGTAALADYQNSVAIASGTSSLNLDDVCFVSLAGCHGADTPKGSLSSAQALANAGVDVVLSWTGGTHPINDLFVEYFLLEAYRAAGPHLSAGDTFTAAMNDLRNDMGASGADPADPSNDPERVLDNKNITGAHGDTSADIIMYPPRYGAKDNK